MQLVSAWTKRWLANRLCRCALNCKWCLRICGGRRSQTGPTNQSLNSLTHQTGPLDPPNLVGVQNCVPCRSSLTFLSIPFSAPDGGIPHLQEPGLERFRWKDIWRVQKLGRNLQYWFQWFWMVLTCKKPSEKGEEKTRYLVLSYVIINNVNPQIKAWFINDNVY